MAIGPWPGSCRVEAPMCHCCLLIDSHHLRRQTPPPKFNDAEVMSTLLDPYRKINEKTINDAVKNCSRWTADCNIAIIHVNPQSLGLKRKCKEAPNSKPSHVDKNKENKISMPNRFVSIVTHVVYKLRNLNPKKVSIAIGYHNRTQQKFASTLFDNQILWTILYGMRLLAEETYV
jgi:hypothetical protein